MRIMSHRTFVSIRSALYKFTTCAHPKLEVIDVIRWQVERHVYVLCVFNNEDAHYVYDKYFFWIRALGHPWERSDHYKRLYIVIRNTNGKGTLIICVMREQIDSFALIYITVMNLFAHIYLEFADMFYFYFF